MTKPPSSNVDENTFVEVPLNQIAGMQTTRIRGEIEGLLPHQFFPPLLLVEFRALNMEHSSFFNLTQVRLFLPPIGLMAFTTWSSHSHGLPLWQPRSHPELGP